MKLLVISDTHGYFKNARNVINKIGDRIDAVIHLGDHDEDAAFFAEEFYDIPFYYVQGNNDYSLNTPEVKMISVNNRKIIFTHGHKQQVYWGYDKIAYWAEENGADAVFFGHTHRPANEYEYIFLIREVYQVLEELIIQLLVYLILMKKVKWKEQ